MIESAARKLAKELVSRREEINRELSRNGVRFGVYKDGEYHDRLFPSGAAHHRIRRVRPA